jgi:predicted GNAT family acetyltransferase
MQKHGIKKPTVQKVLDDLAEKGRLVVKVCANGT